MIRLVNVLVLGLSLLVVGCSKKEAEPPKPVEPREIAVTVEKMSYAPDAVQAKANAENERKLRADRDARTASCRVCEGWGLAKTYVSEFELV